MQTNSQIKTIVAVVAIMVTPLALLAQDEKPELGFFITSSGPGNGGDLGGLEGADAHCQALAEKAGAGDREWRAYLSTSDVDARDRIGEGPWANASGDIMGANLDDLHYNNANINHDKATDENGNKVNSGANGDSPNRHDILTGTALDGTYAGGDDDLSCNSWTSGDKGRAMVGHHDRFRRTTPGSPWNMAHPSRGCSQEALQGSGGDGLFYCFAAD